MSIILIIIIITLITGIVLFLRWATKPLPPWNGLYGQEYKNWKEGKPAKQDNTD